MEANPVPKKTVYKIQATEIKLLEFVKYVLERTGKKLNVQEWF